jgi:hypothetical protein
MLHIILCRCGHAEAWGCPFTPSRGIQVPTQCPSIYYEFICNDGQGFVSSLMFEDICSKFYIRLIRGTPLIFVYKHSGTKKIYAKLAPGWTCDIQTVVLFNILIFMLEYYFLCERISFCHFSNVFLGISKNDLLLHI